MWKAKIAGLLSLLSQVEEVEHMHNYYVGLL